MRLGTTPVIKLELPKAPFCCLPEKVNNREVVCEVGGRPGCDGFFSQGYRSDLSGWRGEISNKGVLQGEAGGFVGGDFVVNQYRVAFA